LGKERRAISLEIAAFIVIVLILIAGFGVFLASDFNTTNSLASETSNISASKTTTTFATSLSIQTTSVTAITTHAESTLSQPSPTCTAPPPAVELLIQNIIQTPDFENAESGVTYVFGYYYPYNASSNVNGTITRSTGLEFVFLDVGNTATAQSCYVNTDGSPNIVYVDIPLIDNAYSLSSMQVHVYQVQYDAMS
jgi:hypothetical protein